jgi:hypothetical protein
MSKKKSMYFASSPPPKVVISIPDMPMPCTENAKFDNPKAI